MGHTRAQWRVPLAGQETTGPEGKKGPHPALWVFPTPEVMKAANLGEVLPGKGLRSEAGQWKALGRSACPPFSVQEASWTLMLIRPHWVKGDEGRRRLHSACPGCPGHRSALVINTKAVQPPSALTLQSLRHTQSGHRNPSPPAWWQKPVCFARLPQAPYSPLQGGRAPLWTPDTSSPPTHSCSFH